MRLTRREVLVGGAAAALGAAGVYELVDGLTSSPRRPPAGRRPPEQHLWSELRIIEDNGVEVVQPALHHQVVTAKVRVEGRRAPLRAAQRELEEALSRLDSEYENTPSGLSIVVAWGLPYFRRYVPALAERHLPIDRRASRRARRQVRAVLDPMRFPSDPDELVLEDNDVVVQLRSDSREHIAEAARALFDELDLFAPTSIRKGFAGGGFDGEQSLPKQMALAAGIPGAELIPDTAELFLGFTSTQRTTLGPSRIANFETLGYADLGPAGYFREGTHMHLSHVFEDVEAWYLNFDFRERVDTMFRPGLQVARDTQTVRQGPRDAATAEQVVAEFRRSGRMGHSGAVQPASRLETDVRGEDGTLYRKGTAVPQRVDFNTLDNPFFWTSRPRRDRYSATPAAGLHFVAFNPTSDDFNRTRLALDGVLPDGTKLPFERGSRGQGFNSVLATTHRQNFLVPPLRHRSFPLVELLS